MLLKTLITSLVFVLSACAGPTTIGKSQLSGSVSAGMPAIDLTTSIYEIAVQDGITYQGVVESLKSLSEANNFVNPANFPIGEHIKQRGIDPQGIKDVHSFCNLSLGTDIMLDHPEFLVFVPCRIAIYEKADANHRLKLFIGLARPTFDLQSIKAPTPRAQAAAVALETTLLEIIGKASRGDF